MITGLALALSLSSTPAPPAYREVLRTDVLVVAVAPRAGRAENVVRAVAVVAAPADVVRVPQHVGPCDAARLSPLRVHWSTRPSLAATMPVA